MANSTRQIEAQARGEYEDGSVLPLRSRHIQQDRLRPTPGQDKAPKTLPTPAGEIRELLGTILGSKITPMTSESSSNRRTRPFRKRVGKIENVDDMQEVLHAQSAMLNSFLQEGDTGNADERNRRSRIILEAVRDISSLLASRIGEIAKTQKQQDLEEMCDE